MTLKEYADALPPIYRDIMVVLGKTHYEELAVQTITMRFLNNGVCRCFQEVLEACERLRIGGFVEITQNIFVTPTALGRRLIEAMAVSQIKIDVPPLPPHDFKETA